MPDRGPTEADLYNGEWRDDAPNGHGSASYANGDEFAGGWVEGQRHGAGMCKYADGSIYDGQWQRGQRHGRGTQKYADGSLYTGDWEHDERSGGGRLKQVVAAAEQPARSEPLSAADHVAFLADEGLRTALKQFGSDMDAV